MGNKISEKFVLKNEGIILPIMQQAKAFYMKHKEGLDYWAEIKKED
jgi:hypothetical protein